MDYPSDEEEVINQAMLLDDPVDTDLDTPMDLLLKNEFFKKNIFSLQQRILYWKISWIQTRL